MVAAFHSDPGAETRAPRADAPRPYATTYPGEPARMGGARPWRTTGPGARGGISPGDARVRTVGPGQVYYKRAYVRRGGAKVG